MNKVLEFFKENDNKELIIKNIRVYGWEFEYDYLIVSSLCKYLFEELEIVENIAPETNENRDGRIREKKYITVHDTGDTDFRHTAKFWSDTVYKQGWEQGPYSASFQYVTGNDGIYHNIPDNEIAYHAGDSTQFDYKLYDTNVTGENEKPVVTISEDGYYEVDGKKTILLAPRAYKTWKEKVVIDRIAKTSDINDQGVLCKLIDGKYYIGETYYSSTYEKISNRGGNNNSIGIESCITVGTDIYLTWQKTAKLVAKLLNDNNLSFDDIKQHHYFSGKNCPQTIRMNGFWEHFIDLVKMEYQVLQFKQEGYKIELSVNDERVKANGRILLRDFNKDDEIEYTISTIKDGVKEELKFKKVLKKFN